VLEEAMINSDWDECFLLHHRPHGETSLIVDVFTKKNGKMSIIAKGAKKPTSKFFGYLTPFTKLKITYTGRSELKTLTNIDRDFSESTNSLSKTSYSLLYINELLIRLLPKDAVHEDLFLLYESFLLKIHSGENIELTLRSFELDMLEMLGYGLDFENEIDKNQSIDVNKNYSFIPERGFRESKNSNFSGRDIINIRMRNLAEVSKKHLKHITQKSIHFCLDGKNLSSREIFKRIKQ
jgi:DNA repair protein RecO (recombination protein O)